MGGEKMEREKKPINIDVGRRIRYHRERRGWTREQLAEQVGITPRFEADIERGSVGVSLTTLRGFCESLGVSSDSLLWDSVSETDVNARLAHLDEKYLPIIDEVIMRQIDLIRLAEGESEQ